MKSNTFHEPCKRRIPGWLTAPVAVCLIAVTVVTPAAQPAPAGSAEGTRMKSHLRSLMVAIDARGADAVPQGDMMGRYPLIATLGLHIYRQDRDIQFLNALYSASTTYMNTALSSWDADGDFLLERTTWRNGAAGVEDVGFNALFALDMLSLSAICLELKKPIEALFWYEGMQTVSGRLITATYDNSAGYFFPYDNSAGGAHKRYYATSALPVFFHRQFGDNFAASVLRNYVLKSQEIGPEIPVHFVDWSLTGSPKAPVSPERLMTSVLLLHVLDWNGMSVEVNRHLSVIRNQLSTRPVGNDAYSMYLAALLRSDSFRHLFSWQHPIALLQSIALLTPTDSKARSSLIQNLNVVDSFLAGEAVDPVEVDTARRNVFIGISSLRVHWKKRTLFAPHHREQVPGFDIYMATSRLFEDVIERLHEVESRIGRAHCREQGFSLSVVPVSEKVVHGQDAVFTVSVSTIRDDMALRSIVINGLQGADTLMKSARPIVVKRGEQALSYQVRRMLPQQVPGTVRTLSFVVEVTFEDGKRLRFHQNQGVYIVPPIAFTLTYPQGRSMRGSVVPLDVVVTKHTHDALLVTLRWFSPAGLSLQEGSTTEITIPAGASTGSMRVNAVMPTPSRPGAFPFSIKLYANNEDGGTLTSSLFNHYEWIYAGPFAKKKDGLSVALAPERGIDLKQTFTGTTGLIQWVTLPPETRSENGNIELGDILPDESVGYLYTVLETVSETNTIISFASATPAALFLNGSEALRISESETGRMTRNNVRLPRGRNNILLKVVSGEGEAIFFQMGDPDDHAADAFNNNLWELVDGYHDFRERERTSSAGDKSQKVVTLTFSDPDANTVAVIGTFNGWSPVSSRMRRNGHGSWEISLHLAPGRYAYRFLVNNSRQVIDPVNGLQEPDGYGGVNSVLFVD